MYPNDPRGPNYFPFYGDATETAVTPPVEEQSSGVPDDSILRALNTFFFGDEARQEERIIVAQIENHRQQALKSAGLIRTFHLNEIAKLQAKLTAVQEQASEERYSAQTESVTRTGVAVMSVLGTAVIGFAALYMGAKAWREIRET